MVIRRFKIDNKTGKSKPVKSIKHKAGESTSDRIKKIEASKPKARKVPKKAAIYHGDVPVKTVKTKGGDYNVYKKNSVSAQSFRSAFRAAAKAGKKTFTWKGKKYTTEVKKKKKSPKKKGRK
jgi:hypothetical protein